MKSGIDDFIVLTLCFYRYLIFSSQFSFSFLKCGFCPYCFCKICYCFLHFILLFRAVIYSYRSACIADGSFILTPLLFFIFFNQRQIKRSVPICLHLSKYCSLFAFILSAGLFNSLCVLISYICQRLSYIPAINPVFGV